MSLDWCIPKPCHKVNLLKKDVVKSLKALMMHVPLTPLSAKKRSIQQKIVEKIYFDMPQSLCIHFCNDNPAMFKLFMYFNGHMTHINVILSETESLGISALMIRRCGSASACCTVFYYTMKALDSSVSIPRILQYNNRLWRYDVHHHKQNTGEMEENAVLFESMKESAKLQNFAMTLNFLASLSGVSINRVFSLYPTVMNTFRKHFLDELKSLSNDAVNLPNAPNAWAKIMNMYTVVNRALHADPKSPILLCLFKKIKTFANQFPNVETRELPKNLAIHIFKKNPWIAHVAPWELKY